MNLHHTPEAPAPAALEELFDPFRRPYLDNPYPIFAQLRSQTPAFFSHELGYWVVTRYEDVRKIFRSTAAFSAVNSIQPLTPPCPAAQARMQLIAASTPAAREKRCARLEQPTPARRLHQD